MAVNVNNGTSLGSVVVLPLKGEKGDGVAQVQSELALLEDRVDQLIAPSGEAPNPAEILDARVGANGVTYNTLGEAIRAQDLLLTNEIIVNNSYDFIQSLNRTNETKSGITYSWNGNSCTITGTASAQNFNNIFGDPTHIPFGMEKGKSYYIDFSGTNVEFEILQLTSSGGIVRYLHGGTKGGWFDVPSDISGMTIRLLVRNGKTVNETVTPRILSQRSNKEIMDMLEDMATFYNGDLPFDSDLNNITSGCWLMASGRRYLNNPLPEAHYGTLLHFNEGIVTFQVVIGGGSSSGTVFVRDAINGSYRQWQSIQGGGGGGNQYIFNEYENTYNVTASPSITTDTNSYLAPTGDTTDVTADIVAMLTQTGVCRLGKGDYYVHNLVMPAGTMIIGSGYSTRVILSGTSDGFAIKMDSHCTVKDLQILGSLSDITISSNVGDRHGILWQGTYTHDQTAPFRGIVDNVYIKNFTGGGITCYDTGYGTYNCLEITNVYIWLCNAGLNISYWSEFHKLTNVRAGACYYGCINNGGNNVFVNCDFSGNKVGFLMDNAQSQSPNNSHGSCVGCVFDHTDNNAGIGIKILDCDNGFMFTGCQIFFSQIDIENSDGVVISNSNFGLSNCNITVRNGGAILFMGNMHQGAPVISISGNNNVHFVNCYNRINGAVIQP